MPLIVSTISRDAHQRHAMAARFTIDVERLTAMRCIK
ncbi:hypothetical protein J3D48_006310 [Pseudomonas fluorescens]|nr:hypothetical protein [Pseudomonas fluorescens]